VISPYDIVKAIRNNPELDRMWSRNIYYIEGDEVAEHFDIHSFKPFLSESRSENSDGVDVTRFCSRSNVDSHWENPKYSSCPFPYEIIEANYTASHKTTRLDYDAFADLVYALTPEFFLLPEEYLWEDEELTLRRKDGRVVVELMQVVVENEIRKLIMKTKKYNEEQLLCPSVLLREHLLLNLEPELKGYNLLLPPYDTILTYFGGFKQKVLLKFLFSQNIPPKINNDGENQNSNVGGDSSEPALKKFKTDQDQMELN